MQYFPWYRLTDMDVSPESGGRSSSHLKLMIVVYGISWILALTAAMAFFAA